MCINRFSFSLQSRQGIFFWGKKSFGCFLPRWLRWRSFRGWFWGVVSLEKVFSVQCFLFERKPRRQKGGRVKPAPAVQSQPNHSFFYKKTNRTRFSAHLFKGGPRGEKKPETPSNQANFVKDL
ncbi:MAG: hypothetical protein D6714_19210 [Bacteroidetes bacterium]|nr:MAG: hypothetical protein D6714_19210 [Bacteroidota bacterium]